MALFVIVDMFANSYKIQTKFYKNLLKFAVSKHSQFVRALAFSTVKVKFFINTIVYK